MYMISEEELRRTNHPIYEKRVEEMRGSREQMHLAYEEVGNWTSANVEDQRAFLKLCQVSVAVAAIAINDAMFPSEPRFLFKGDLWVDARRKIIPEPFKIRIAAVEENDACIYFRKPKTINRSSWYRSEPRGEMAQLCGLFGYKTFGYIDPSETEVMWFKHLYGMLPFNKITGVRIEKTEVLFFEHFLNIVRFSTKK